jgi:hypothetical protein
VRTKTANEAVKRIAAGDRFSQWATLSAAASAHHVMTRSDFQVSAKRMRVTGTVISLGVILPIVCGLIYFTDRFGQPLNRLHDTLRQHLPEVVAAGLFGISIAVYVAPIFGLFVLLVYLADRWFGLRCPHCRRSLTLRCLHERVLQSGECSLCHGKVFD